MQIKYHFSYAHCIVAINVLSKTGKGLYDYDTKKWGVRDEQWNVVIPTMDDEIE